MTAHAILSASGSHRWMSCTPSARLEEHIPDVESDYAKEGTLAHEIAELKANNAFYPKTFTKRKINAHIKTLQADSLYDAEMLTHTDFYVEELKKVAFSYDKAPIVEVEARLDFSEYVPEGFGTADCLMLSGSMLSVIDFKYGKGVKVDAKDNSQLMLYALGAYLKYKPFYTISEVTMTIIQPRLEHVDSYTVSADELMEFAELAKMKAELAFNGEGAFSPSEKACRFCKAKGCCKARADKNVALANFGKPEPKTLSDDILGEYINLGEDLEGWLRDIKAYALSRSLAGYEVTGYKAVEGRGSRAWTDFDEAFKSLISSGVDEAMLYERKPLTLAQCEKLVGKKDFYELVGGLVEVKQGKPTLVKATDKRQAITNKVKAEDVF